MRTSVTLAAGQQTISAELHAPSGPPKGLVIIAYGSDGLTDDLSGPWKTLIRGYAESLAEDGFIAAIPDYLAATATPPGPAVFDAMQRHKAAWEAALGAAVDELVASSQTDPEIVGLLGFSLGGHLVLRTRQKARTLVSFFAPVLDGICTGSALKHAQLHHGKADRTPGTEFANAGVIEHQLKLEGTACELFAYPGAGHGFIGTDQANNDARDLSKTRTRAFFEAHLGAAATPAAIRKAL